jgi:uncharacterized membrane protein YfbV (UPF0208 family)
MSHDHKEPIDYESKISKIIWVYVPPIMTVMSALFLVVKTYTWKDIALTQTIPNQIALLREDVTDNKKETSLNSNEIIELKTNYKNMEVSLKSISEKLDRLSERWQYPR